MLGEGPLADALRRRFGHPAEGAEATVLLDARVPLDAKRDPPAGLPLVTLCWGHSASLACARYGREAVGFSLVAPLGDDAVVELLVPESGADASLEAARRFFEAHGLATVTLADSAGGIGFRILALLVNEAVGALAEGLAGADAIDAAMELGMNLPLGPLAWGSALGLPTLLAALEGLRDELGDPRYVPHPKLRRRAALGLTGWHG